MEAADRGSPVSCCETVQAEKAEAILYITVLGGFAGSGLAWLGLFSEKVTLHTEPAT